VIQVNLVYLTINIKIDNMSTTFGVKIKTSEAHVVVARRVGVGNGKVEITWTNEVAHLLPDDTEVEPLDNSAQGIHTIGDIKKAMNHD